MLRRSGATRNTPGGRRYDLLGCVASLMVWLFWSLGKVVLYSVVLCCVMLLLLVLVVGIEWLMMVIVTLSSTQCNYEIHQTTNLKQSTMLYQLGYY